MKRILMFAGVMGLLAVSAGVAQAAPQHQGSANARIGVLEAKVRQLQTRVARDEDVTLCGAGLQSDVNTGFFNIFSVMLGMQQENFSIDDGGACARIGISRSPKRALNATERSPFGLLRFHLQVMQAGL
jgi:hypothetical protein